MLSASIPSRRGNITVEFSSNNSATFRTGSVTYELDGSIIRSSARREEGTLHGA